MDERGVQRVSSKCANKQGLAMPLGGRVAIAKRVAAGANDTRSEQGDYSAHTSR